MSSLTLILIVFSIFFFILYVAKSSEWYYKAQAYDKMKRGDEYVPNYEELMQTRQYEMFKARVDYLVISLSGFVNWMLRRVNQFKLIR